MSSAVDTAGRIRRARCAHLRGLGSLVLCGVAFAGLPSVARADEAPEPAPSAAPATSAETTGPLPGAPSQAPPSAEAQAPVETSAGTATAPEPPLNELTAVNGVRRQGWWGAWGAIGGGGVTGLGARWAPSARGDANPVGDLLVSAKLRYAKGMVDTDAAVGLLFSRDFKADGVESWKVETGRDQKYIYYDVHGTKATIRTEWALAGGARLLHLGGDASHTETIVQAGLERLRANSERNRYTTSMRALYNPSAGKWGGAVTWMYANPPTWRFVYGIDAGLLPSSGDSIVYLMLDVGIAFGN